MEKKAKSFVFGSCQILKSPKTSRNNLCWSSHNCWAGVIQNNTKQSDLRTARWRGWRMCRPTSMDLEKWHPAHPIVCTHASRSVMRECTHTSPTIVTAPTQMVPTRFRELQDLAGAGKRIWPYFSKKNLFWPFRALLGFLVAVAENICSPYL